MRLLAPAAIVALLVAVPGTAAARSITFGSTLAEPPTTTAAPGTCDVTGANWDTGPCTRVGIGFAATGSVQDRVRAPANGRIRRIRLRSGVAGTIRFTLVRIRDVSRQNGRGEGRVVSKGKLIRVKGRGNREHGVVESFKANLRVRRGDHLALKGSSFGAVRCQGGDMEQLVFQPPLVRSEDYRATSEFDACTLLVQATVRTG